MTFQRDVRAVIAPRSQVSRVVDKLVDGANGATSVTLTLGEVSMLVTLIRSAQRVARMASGDVVSADVAALTVEVRRLTEAWEAAERKIWALEVVSPSGVAR